MLKILLNFIVIFSLMKTQAQIDFEDKIILENAGKEGTRCIISDDVNGDNFKDLIVGSQRGLCWFQNLDGLGNFGNSVLIDNGDSISNINFKDLNGDGFKDLIYTKYNSLITNYSLFWSKSIGGTGTFEPPVILGTGVTYKVFVLDMDNDGDIDIVKSGTAFQILKNDGLGIFTTQTNQGASEDVFLIDASGDQLPDLFIKSGYNLYYQQQNPDGTFFFKETMDGFVTNNYSSFITGGDVDNDGDNDIAIINENGLSRTIKFYKNNNNVFANFVTLVVLPSTNGSSSADYSSIFIKDFDNDGLNDIVSQNTFFNRISWYKNLGLQVFGTEQIISTSIANGRLVHISDLNNDNNLDIVTTDIFNNNIVWYDNSSGNGLNLVEKQLSNSVVLLPTKVVAGDLNGDGYKDVLVTSKFDNRISWYKNTNGLGDFSGPQKTITNTLLNAENGLIADLNNDGKNDVIAFSNPDDIALARKIVLFKNLGNALFAPVQIIYSFFTENIIKLETIDVDNDNDLDLVTSFSGGTLKIFKNNGNGTFATPISFANSAGYFEATDVDNDGDKDLIVAGSNSFFWLNNIDGSGDYSIKTIITTNLGIPSKFVIGDINNDGLKEIIYVNSSLGKMTINDNNTFSSQTAINYLGSSNVLDLADLDNDGDLDIVCSTSVSSSNPSTYPKKFRYYLNQGNGDFSLPEEIYFDDINNLLFSTDFRSLAISDLNGDGKKDVLLCTSQYTKVIWFHNKGLFQNEIKGKVSVDILNNNCLSGSNAAQQVLVTTSKPNYSNSTFTNSNGDYQFKLAEGNFSTTITTPFVNYNSNPLTYSNNFLGINNNIIADFCLQPNQIFNDLEVSFYPLNNARPGFISKYAIVVKNKGTNVVNNNLAINFNNNKLQFVSANQPILNQVTNTINFSLTNLLPFQQFEAILIFQVNTSPVTELGDVINFSVSSILSDDVSPTNNLFSYNQTIVGSYDPNDIKVLEGSEVLISQQDDYLHYIIRFQNTGNFYAEKVLVTLPISDKLDWTTLQLESSSHKHRTEISNVNIVSFIFDAIYLPSQNTNDLGSNGYITFKIKPKSTVNVGDIVQEKASIYFDYNPPIETNQVNTMFVDVLGTTLFNHKNVTVYPNPVTDLINIDSNEKNYKINIFDVLGQKIINNQETNRIDFSNFPTGIYLLKISFDDKESQIIRFLKK